MPPLRGVDIGDVSWLDSFNSDHGVKPRDRMENIFPTRIRVGNCLYEEWKVHFIFKFLIEKAQGELGLTDQPQTTANPNKKRRGSPSFRKKFQKFYNTVKKLEYNFCYKDEDMMFAEPVYRHPKPGDGHWGTVHPQQYGYEIVMTPFNNRHLIQKRVQLDKDYKENW